ncbi:hypothetical protein J6590_066012 [Homalodisca vitripennis]|nr:hypothetical protein J6590_066012 [Homalodisca vitripennis]
MIIPRRPGTPSFNTSIIVRPQQSKPQGSKAETKGLNTGYCEYLNGKCRAVETLCVFIPFQLVAINDSSDREPRLLQFLNISNRNLEHYPMDSSSIEQKAYCTTPVTRVLLRLLTANNTVSCRNVPRARATGHTCVRRLSRHIPHCYVHSSTPIQLRNHQRQSANHVVTQTCAMNSSVLVKASEIIMVFRRANAHILPSCISQFGPLVTTGVIPGEINKICKRKLEYRKQTVVWLRSSLLCALETTHIIHKSAPNTTPFDGQMHVIHFYLSHSNSTHWVIALQEGFTGVGPHRNAFLKKGDTKEKIAEEPPSSPKTAATGSRSKLRKYEILNL